ncbi:3' exoribonuclease family domain 1 protein [Brugia pahangi]
MEVQLSEAEKVFIIHGAQEGLRADGRGPLDYRPIIVQTGVLATTNGSARVQIGSTDLLIGVKAELISVDTTVYRNRLNFFVDCSANATPLLLHFISALYLDKGEKWNSRNLHEYTVLSGISELNLGYFRVLKLVFLLNIGRGGEEFADELSAALDAAYDNNYVLPDLKKLILSPMHAWKLFVDIVLLQCDGNVIDAAGLGVKAALKDTEISKVIVRPADEGKYTIDLPDDNTVWKLDTSRVPLFVSVNRLGTAKIVDNSLTEEACTRTSVWIAVAPQFVSDINHNQNNQCAVKRDGSIITFMRQCGGGTLEIDSLEEMISIGLKTVHQLHEALNQRLMNENWLIEKPLSTFLQ